MSDSKNLGYAPKAQPKGAVSTNPGDVVHLKLFAPESAQVTSDEASEGHYESQDGHPKWHGGK